MISWENIDAAPLDENVFCEIPFTVYQYLPNEQRHALITLLKRYLQKFFEKYELNLSFICNRFFYSLSLDNDDWGDEWMEDEMDYGTDSCELFYDVLGTFGWDCFSFPFDNQDLDFDDICNKEDLRLHIDIIEKYLQCNGLSSKQIEMALNEKDLLLDCLSFDYGECWFMWNDKLSCYMNISEASKLWLEENYGYKVYKINYLIDQVKAPLNSSWSVTTSGRIGDLNYFAFDKGDVGDGATAEFDALNPNWIVCMYILDLALDDILFLLEKEFRIAV